MKPDKQTLHFAGRVVRITTDEVVLPNGHRALLEVVHHPGGAAAVALDESSRVCLLRQYRYVACGWAIDGTIVDCKTALGLLRARETLRTNGTARAAIS
ncbi:MAG TPA: hypothetical protein VF764_00125 [Steroidobacteraceae bacterium]